MKIIYDHQILIQEIGGISRYFKSLIKHLLLMGHNISNPSILHKSIYFKNKNKSIFIGHIGLNIIDEILKSPLFKNTINKINEYYTIHKLKNEKYDILHVTDNRCDYLNKLKSDIPIVVTVHDLIPEIYQETFKDSKQRLLHRKKIFLKADQLICISESTKIDLMRYYNINEKKITVVYHGCPDYMIRNKQNKITLNIKKKYLLYIGDRKAIYKNYMNTLKYLTKVLKQNKDLHFVCIGSKLMREEIALINEENLSDRIHAFRVNDDELYSIYENALCLIIPSLYEGFGFPILEAMKASCPIISSNTSSLPEIAQNAALYFNPITFDGFDQALHTIMHNKSALNSIMNNQISRLKNFSWTITAEKTLKTYEKVIETKYISYEI